MKKNAARLLCGALILTLAGCAAKPVAQTMNPTIVVETAAAQVGSLSTSSTYIGTVSAEGTASVISLVSGTVDRVNVSVGDTVAAGDPLCSLDDESARLNLQNAKASVVKAQAGMESARAGVESAQAGVANAQAGLESAKEGVQSAQSSYQSAAANFGGEELTILEERVRIAQESYDAMVELLELGAVSQVEVDQAKQALLSAQAALESGRANLESAQSGVRSADSRVQSAQVGIQSANASLQSAQVGVQSADASLQSAQVGVASAEYQLSLYHLTSPISGVVEAVNVTENGFASQGSVAFVISNARNKTVSFYVTDAVRSIIQVGQNVAVSAGGKDYQGTVSEVGGMVDPSTGMFLVKALIENGTELPDGLSVSVTTVSNREDNSVVVPSDALWFEDGRAYVYLSQDRTAVRREVELALYTAEYASLTGGISDGDTVITSWAATLHDGAAVRDAGTEG